MHWEARFRDLAARQAGVVGIDQLPMLRCDGDHWSSAKRSGRWQPLSRRVLRIVGLPVTDDQRAHAAVLDAGGDAFLHGGSALGLLGVRGFDLARLQVARSRGTTSTPCELAAVHRVRDIDPADLTTIRGVRTMTPLRAIWSEASRYSDERSFERGVLRIGRLLDVANRRDLVRWDELHRSIDRLGRRGRAGTRVMRAAAERRPPGTSATESRNEDRFEELLHAAGAPPMERQVVVGGVRPIGRSDHRDPDLPLVVEVNSLTFHSTPSDQDADEGRYRGMNAAGFTVVVVWEDALWSHTASVLAAVAEGRRRARRREPSVIHTVGCPWRFDPSRIIVGGDERRYRG